MSCDEHHCVTCSDEAVSMRVTEVRGDGIAVCGDAEVLTALIGEVEPGDELLVHAGAAIARAK